MKIEHSTDIAAPIERVWDLTVEIEAWPQHTPTMTSVERLDSGPIAVGSKARVKQPAQRARVWTVTAIEPQKRFAWATRWLGTTMTGIHSMEQSATGTTNTLTIDIEGSLAPVIGVLLRRPIRSALARENEGFKRAAEG